MGKTRRTYPYDYTYFRRPRGQRAALIRGDRAVPPSDREDRPFSREHGLPRKFAEIMRQRGWPDTKIAASLATKYRLPHRQIQYILDNL